MRNEMLAPSALPLYAAWGFDANATATYLDAVADTLSSPNVVPSPAIPGMNYLR